MMATKQPWNGKSLAEHNREVAASPAFQAMNGKYRHQRELIEQHMVKTNPVLAAKLSAILANQFFENIKRTMAEHPEQLGHPPLEKKK